jgi:putative aldouronate transport system permease protein
MGSRQLVRGPPAGKLPLTTARHVTQQTQGQHKLPSRSQRQGKILKSLSIHRYIYLMVLPVLLYYVVFSYFPMYGAIIAFKDFSPGKGILASDWVGFRHFAAFFNSFYFVRVVRNTILINLYSLVLGFPVPIVFALLLNEIRRSLFKRVAQTISYLPHFVSIIVVCGMIIDFTSSSGVINDVIELLGGARQTMLQRPELFRAIYVLSDIWKEMGWESIVFLAALTGVDMQLYEAARIDGAGRWRQVWHVSIPGIIPTAVILLILRIGNMLNLGFEKIILLYNPLVYETADVISSFVYRKGLLEAGYSYSAAVGLFNSVISFALLLGANYLSRRVNETSLW